MGEKQMNCEVLELEGSFNARDLGGYPADGKTVQKRRFIRTGSLSGLTKKGIDQVRALGVDCVIDLRSSAEVSRAPDRLIGAEGIAHYHVPMLDYIQSNITSGDFASFPKSMGQMYLGLLDNSQADFLRVFRLFADPAHRCILFHCTAGKDRTGVTAMLLLLLGGVSAENVVEDYSWSQVLIGPMVEKENKKDSDIPPFVFQSLPETMEFAIGHLNEVYGGAEGYLKKAGLSAEEMRQVRDKLFAK